MVMTRGPRRTVYLAVSGLTITSAWLAATAGPRWESALIATAGVVALGAVAVALRRDGAADPGVEHPGEPDPAGSRQAELSGALAALGAATSRLSGAGERLVQATQAGGIQSQLTTTAAEHMLDDVSMASTMSEELASAMRAIAADAAEVARAGGDAATLVDSASTLAGKLGESSIEIENVLQVIGKIAAQTNMLALNATIEAARSGEAGKGFKVVANEVKDLSRATDTATKNIEVRVQTMQEDSSTVVRAIQQISVVISRVNEAQATIAASVERTASGALDQVLGEAVSGAMAIAMNLGSINEATERASASAAEVLMGIEAVQAAALGLSRQLESASAL